MFLRRRDALRAGLAVGLLCAATGPTASAADRSSAPAGGDGPCPSCGPRPRPVLLGSDEGLAGFDPVAGRWWSWSCDRDPSSPAVADARATWSVGRDGRLRRRLQADGSVRVVDGLGPVHALAAADDGEAVFAAHGLAITLLDAEGRPRHQWACRDLAGRREGPAVALAWHAGRRSLLASLPAVGELWIVSLDPAAPPIHDGLVHDYRMGEAIPTPGLLGVRRAPVPEAASRLWADGRQPWVVAHEAHGLAGIVHLDVRRRIAAVPRAGPRIGDGTVAPGADGGSRWWVPVEDGVVVVDARRWVVEGRMAAPMRVDRLATAGSGVIAAGRDGGTVCLGRLDADTIASPPRPIPDVRGPVAALWTNGPGSAPSVGLVTAGPGATAVVLDAAGHPVARWPAPSGDWRPLA